MSESASLPEDASLVLSSPLILVFTDVVGSSAAKRSESLGADASARDRAYLGAIQTRHLEVVRTALAEYQGEEIMTIGDSFFLTFTDAVDAVRCCAAIQQRLAARPIDTPNGPLRLRIGIHAGTPEFFENSWHGTAVDTAARVEATGSPCQIVVSDDARKLMEDPIGLKFRPLGVFGLKGIGDVRIWDVDYDQHGLRAAAVPSNAQKARTRKVRAVLTMLLVLAVSSSIGWALWQRYQQQKAAALLASRKSSIIVADFENKTGEPVFDTMLTQALAIQLQQSPVLSLEGAQHLRQSMQYLGKPADTPVTAEIAREIGEREGVKAYISGTIVRLGESYMVSANAINTRTGDYIASGQTSASSKDHVMDALSTVATTLRAHLGESLDSIQKLDVPFGQATTPSLEAFRAFSQGEVEHSKGNDVPEAAGFYRRATEIDPNFAMAWMRLGTAYWNAGFVAKANEGYTRAFSLSNKVSEREKLTIQALYYESVTGNLQKALVSLELLTKTYPLDGEGFLNMGFAQGLLGRMEPAIASLQRALAVAPATSSETDDLIIYLTNLDRLDEADKIAGDAMRTGADSTFSLYAIYFLDLLHGDTAGMAKVAARAEGKADEFQMTETVAFGQEYLGQYYAAGASYERAAQQAAKAKAPDAEAAIELAQLTGMALTGNCDGAGNKIRAALALDTSKATLAYAVYAAGLCNQADTVSSLEARLAKEYPEDTLIHEVTLPTTRAALALATHDPRGALHDLEGIKPYDLVSSGAYLEGLAYLQLADGASAVDAFKRATRYRGSALNLPMQDYGQGQLGLARAYTLTGDKAAAGKAYEALFDTWKNADADLPQLLSAKKEYGALRARP